MNRLSLFAACLVAAPAVAQDKDLFRLDFTEPQMILSPGGRMGACDQLRFTRDGRQLLAVGDDKVVHTWDVQGDALSYKPPLRWNVFRERRGSAYSLAISPDERFAALAGYGRRDADVAVLDRSTGKIARALSAAPGSPYAAAGGTVWSLAYNDAGDALAVGQEDGSVWFWGFPKGQPEAVVRVVAPVTVRSAVEGRLAKIVWVGFAGTAVRFARGDGTVGEVNPDGSALRPLFKFPYPLAEGVTPRDGRWLAGRPLKLAEGGATVEVRALPDGKLLNAVAFTDKTKNEHRLFPVVVAADPAGTRLVVANARLENAVSFAAPQPGDVGIYDLTAHPPRLDALEVFDGTDGKPATAPDAIAFHPTDPTRLAVAGGLDHETGLWKVAGTRLVRAAAPNLGVGRGVWQVGAATDGTVLAFRRTPNLKPASPNDRGKGPWRFFDLAALAWKEGTADAVPQDLAVPTWQDWTVRFDPTNEFAWDVVHPDGFEYPLPFAKATDDRPTCFTFLPTAGRTVRLAVGHYWGFSLFEFGQGTKPVKVAKGIGHHGYVTSIAPARGGQMVVTGSNDQTVCVWSLQPWPNHPVLGAAFERRFDAKTQQRGFAVTAVHQGSPAWEAGLLPGDRITRMGYDLAWVPPQGDPKEGDWEKLLERIEPDRELVMEIDRPAGDAVVRTAVKTRLLTRPQARLFPTADYDWLLYKYLDYYYASSTNGDSYLGWQISGKAAADTPEYHPADRFRELFYQPDRVRNDVVRLVREPTRPLTREYLPPAVEVTASVATVTDQPVSLEIAVRPRADVSGRAVSLEKVELWLDEEVLLAEWAGGAQAFTKTAVVPPHQLRVGKNRLSVVGYARTRGEASVEVVYAPAKPKPAALRGLAVGVDKYPYLTAARQLEASVNDAKLVKLGLEALAKNNLVRSAKVDVLADGDATAVNVLAKISEVGEGLGPDDWLVLFLAGHGFADPEETGTGGVRVRPGSWFFCAYSKAGEAPFDFDAANTAEKARGMAVGLKKAGCAIDGRVLLDALARVNCRKLVLLDSCHSGAIAQDPGRDLRPGGRGAVVFTAAAPDETASEFDLTITVDGKEVTERHGFFSVAVFNALGKDREAVDRNGDGVVTLEELHLTLAREVKELRRKAGVDRPGRRSQTVLASPPDLRNVVFVASK